MADGTDGTPAAPQTPAPLWPGGTRGRLASGGLATLAVAAGLLLPYLVQRPDTPARVAGEVVAPAPPPAQAQAPAPRPTLSVASEAAPPALEPPDAGGLLLRLGLATVFVLALTVGGLRAAKRWLPGARAGGPVAGAPVANMRVLKAVRLDARSRVFLVEVRGQRLLAGVDLAGLQSLVPVPRSPAAGA